MTSTKNYLLIMLKSLLLVSLVYGFLAMTWFKNEQFKEIFSNVYTTSFLFSASLLLTALIPFIIRHMRKGEAYTIPAISKIDIPKLVIIVVTSLAGIVFAAWKLNITMQNFSFMESWSDVIPSIDIYVDRLMKSEPVYTRTLDMVTYQIPPTYLPMQWLPFVVAAKFGFDLRWIAFAIFSIGVLLYQYQIYKKSADNLLLVFTASALPFVLYYGLAEYNPSDFVCTVETMVVGYYMILFFAISGESNLLKALALTICLLSRFSVLFWIPLFILILFFSKSRRNAILISLYTFAGILLIYVIPFLSEDWMSFKKGYDYYTGAALAEWDGQPWQQNGEKPTQLFRGVGLAAYFYDHLGGTVEERMLAFKKMHLIASLFIIALLSAYYVRYRKLWEENRAYFFVISLQLYFAVFYSFIQVPYTYLFYVPVFTSMFIYCYEFLYRPSPRFSHK